MALDQYDEDFDRLQAAMSNLNAINLRRFRGHADFRDALRDARNTAAHAHNVLIEVEQAEEAKLETEEGRDG